MNQECRCPCASRRSCRQAELSEFTLGAPSAREPGVGTAARDSLEIPGCAGAGPAQPHRNRARMHQRPPLDTRVRQLTLPAHPAAVSRVRRKVDQALTEWGLKGLSDTTLLLVSELVTNAVRVSANDNRVHSWPRRRAEIAVTLSVGRSSLLIEVWDAHPDPADPQRPDATSESGRGLLLVEALAGNWGQRAMGCGKVVWCEIEFLPAAVAEA